MGTLKKPITVETTFADYTLEELIGEGGAGRVYGGRSGDGSAVAVKVLSQGHASSDKRRRFKNEIAFLARNRHPNIIPVIDHGVARSDGLDGPFYVMPRCSGSLRTLLNKGLQSAQVMPYFGQILNGVEAAHMQGAVHRDIKPENILFDSVANKLAIADFGIARLTEDVLATLVETSPGQRLANFQYAAPEQRQVGQPVTETADIYALGLILNEMFTGTVPHGTGYLTIGQVSNEHAYLDRIVDEMIRQQRGDRPASIAAVKAYMQRYEGEAISLQKLSKISETVILTSEIDDPLAIEPPRLVGADWNRGRLSLTLDRPVSHNWIQALQRMGNHTSVLGHGPETFAFRGTEASVSAQEHEVQQIIDFFKQWLPNATRTLRAALEDNARREESERRRNLELERQAEEQRLRVVANIRL